MNSSSFDFDGQNHPNPDCVWVIQVCVCVSANDEFIWKVFPNWIRKHDITFVVVKQPFVYSRGRSIRPNIFSVMLSVCTLLLFQCGFHVMAPWYSYPNRWWWCDKTIHIRKENKTSLVVSPIRTLSKYVHNICFTRSKWSTNQSKLSELHWMCDYLCVRFFILNKIFQRNNY